MDYDLNLKPKTGREREKKALAIRALECDLICSLSFSSLVPVGYHAIAWNTLSYGKLNSQVRGHQSFQYNNSDTTDETHLAYRDHTR
jgi:hypothetical protein